MHYVLNILSVTYACIHIYVYSQYIVYDMPYDTCNTLYVLLYTIDHVAYVRFASVYRDFQDVAAFREEIDKLLDKKVTPQNVSI